MNKKGFTLVEIISVIAILGIIGVIVFPIVSGILQQKSSELDKNQHDLIISAAKAYVADNAFNYNNCITINDLKVKGYLDNIEIKNQVDNSTYNGSVKIDYISGEYQYEIYQNTNCTN